MCNIGVCWCACLRRAAAHTWHQFDLYHALEFAGGLGRASTWAYGRRRLYLVALVTSSYQEGERHGGDVVGVSLVVCMCVEVGVGDSEPGPVAALDARRWTLGGGGVKAAAH
jgi:hypothetical protein